MGKPTERQLCINLAAFILILTASVFRWVDVPFFSGFLRTFIYILLYLFWGLSLYGRISHPEARRYAAVIAGLMVFWFLVRTIKYGLPEEAADLSRYFWYLYYLPMIFIPVFALFTALEVGLPEKERLSRSVRLLSVPAALLFLLVLTNDLHQLVFTFPENDTVFTDNNNGYSFGYYLILIFILLCVMSMLGTLKRKSRLPGRKSRITIPCIPVWILLIYSLLYNSRMAWLRVWFGDMTAVFCLMIAATIELCLCCGFIQTNTCYDELFAAGSLRAQIADRENIVRLENADASELTAEQRLAAAERPWFKNRTTVIKGQAIGYGHVFWEEDVSELVESIGQIEENCRDLSEQNLLLRKNLETEKKILSLQEKNRIHDLFHRKAAPQIEKLGRILSDYDGESDAAERRRLLAGAAVIGAYVKRCGNLFLMSQREETADSRDLVRCFEESFMNLELLGVECLCTIPPEIRLGTGDMLRVYSAFETVLEDCMYDLHQVWIHARERGEQLILTMEFAGGTELYSPVSGADAFSEEDGSVRFTFRLRKGGESG